MWEVLSWLLFVVFSAGLLVVGGLLMRGYLSGASGTNPFSSTMFAQKPDRRLDVVEQANLDGRRKLVLVRRDNVEHLIMTGGPVDVVVETKIDTRQELRNSVATVRSNDQSHPRLRPARELGRAANE